MTATPTAPPRRALTARKAPTATNTTPTKTQAEPAASQNTNKWYFQGNAELQEEGKRAKALQEARSNQRRMPLRFSMKATDGLRRVVVLDTGENAFGLYEWDIWDNNAKQSQTHIASPYNFDPIQRWVDTKAGKHINASKSLKLFLTVMDLQPFVDKNGNERQYSKKLLVLKGSAREQMARYAEQVGNIRGLVLDMDRSGDKSPSTGIPQLILEGAGVMRLTEEEILSEFGHEERKRDDGTVYAKANSDCYPYAYTELFEEPNLEDQARLFGIEYVPMAGTAAHADRILNGTSNTTQATNADVQASEKPASRLNLRNRAASSTQQTTERAEVADIKQQASEELDESALPWDDSSES